MIEHTIDITVQLGTFRNFELLSTGAYRIRVLAYSLITEKGLQKKVYALPYLIMTGREGPSANGFFELADGTIDSKKNAYLSKSFYIDFSDVFKEINQMCVFRFVFEGNVPDQITLEFDLMILEQGKNEYGFDTTQFMKMTSSKINAFKIQYGMHEFFPVIFADFHLSYIECLLHSTYRSFQLEIKEEKGKKSRTLAHTYRHNGRKVTSDLGNVKTFEEFAIFSCFKGSLQLRDYFWRRFSSNISNQLFKITYFLNNLLRLAENSYDTGILSEQEQEEINNHRKQISETLFEPPEFLSDAIFEELSITDEKTIRRWELFQRSPYFCSTTKTTIRSKIRLTKDGILLTLDVAKKLSDNSDQKTASNLVHVFC